MDKVMFGETLFLPNTPFNPAEIVHCCQPLTSVLKWLSINIDLKNESPSKPFVDDDNEVDYKLNEGLFMKIYRSFIIGIQVIFIAIFMLAIYYVITGFPAEDDQRPNYMPLFYVEPIICLALIISFSRQRNRLIKIIATLVTIILSLDTSEDRVGLKAIRKCSVALAMTVLIVIAFDIGLASLKSAHFLLDIELGNITATRFSLSASNEMDAVIEVVDTLLYSVLINSFSDIYGLFQMFVFYLLYRSFHQLNLFVATKELVQCRQVHQVQCKHQEIVEIVDIINELFATGIFFFSVILTIKLTVALNSLPNEIFSSIRYRNIYSGVDNAITFIRVIGHFAGTTLMASKVFVEAQDTITVMLTTSLQNPTSRPKDLNQTKDIKECHVTALFLCQRTLSPVGIKGLNVFTINYGFLVIVVSTVITYVSTLSSFADAGERRSQEQIIALNENRLINKTIINYNND